MPPTPVGSGESGVISDPNPRQEARGSYDRNGFLLELQEKNSQIKALKESTSASQPTDPGYFDLVHLDGQKNAILKTIVYHESHNDEFGYLTSTIQPFGFTAQRYIMGAYLEQMRYDEAAVFLQGMTASSVPEQDYLFAQNINLQRLTNSEYEITESTLNSLRTIVEKHHPLGGKAHAVYHALTGGIVVCEDGLDVEIDETDLRERKLEKEIFVYPNPTNGNLNLKGIADIVRIDITSSTGLQMESIRIQDDKVLNMDKFPVGIYLLSFYDIEDRLIQVIKVTKV